MARKLGLLAQVLVIAAAAAYLFVYLYRWEWNRALIAGVFFIAAEVALASFFILEKLHKIEQKLDESASPGHDTLRAIRDTAPEPADRFKWLREGGDGLSVFIPVLMGAGIVFSGIAWVVERFARLTARPALEQGLSARLGPLALPEGGFLAPVPAAATYRAGGGRAFRSAFLVFVTVAAVSMMIDALGDLTQNRPQLDVKKDAGVVSLQITKRGWARSDKAAAQSLWRACVGTVSPEFKAQGFVVTGKGRVDMLIAPAPGASAQRRLTGCLSDATIDNLSAAVRSFAVIGD